MMKTIVSVLSIIGILFNIQIAKAQDSMHVNWISFNELHTKLLEDPKPVMVIFHAHWCATCLKMDSTTFQNEQVVEKLNRDYYVVKMDVESKDTVTFGSQVFINKRIKRVNPVHEIALLMASRENKPFSLPAIVFLDESFTPISRYFQFLDAKNLYQILDSDSRSAKN